MPWRFTAVILDFGTYQMVYINTFLFTHRYVHTHTCKGKRNISRLLILGLIHSKILTTLVILYKTVIIYYSLPDYNIELYPLRIKVLLKVFSQRS